MHTYDVLTKNGLLIHLSMSTFNTCYIIVYDIYTITFNLKYFTDIESAKAFIHSC